MGRTYTTNLALSKPDYGQAGIDWYQWMNDNLDTIDLNLARTPMLTRAVGGTKDRRYLAGHPINTALSTGAPSANYLRALPFFNDIKRTVDRLGFNVTSGTAGSARVGIYADDGAMYPGALVLDSGVLDTAASAVKEATVSQVLSANTLYWLAIVCSVAPTVRTIPIAACYPFLGLDSAWGTALAVGWSVSFTYAALPATFTAGGTVITADPVPALGVRFSA